MCLNPSLEYRKLKSIVFKIRYHVQNPCDSRNWFEFDFAFILTWISIFQWWISIVSMNIVYAVDMNFNFNINYNSNNYRWDWWSGCKVEKIECKCSLYCPLLIIFLSVTASSDPNPGFVQILEKSRKVLNSNCKFSRSGKSCKMTLGMEKFGKVMESVRAYLENYSAWVLIVPSFAYNNFACM